MIDAWLEPLSDSACGDDLEYDNDFLVLVQAAAGKPETQFSAGEPPDWRQVRSLSEGLFERTRDLRVAVMWGRALLHAEGARSLPESLRLIHGLLQRFWDDLHPKLDPDDGDAFARINTLSEMVSSAGFAGDLRQAVVVRNRAIGEVRGRDVELSLGLLDARPEDSPMPIGSMSQLLTEAASSDPVLAALPKRSLEEIERLSGLMRERVGYERCPDFSALTAFFNGLVKLMPSGGAAGGASAQPGDDEQADSAEADGPQDAAAPRGAAAARSGGGLGTRIETRADAVRAITLVCDYLERTEPTSPAQLLLRRAATLVNKNFLELVREFAPESFAEVAKVMGVKPDESGDGQY